MPPSLCMDLTSDRLSAVSSVIRVGILKESGSSAACAGPQCIVCFAAALSVTLSPTYHISRCACSFVLIVSSVCYQGVHSADKEFYPLAHLKDLSFCAGSGDSEGYHYEGRRTAQELL